MLTQELFQRLRANGLEVVSGGGSPPRTITNVLIWKPEQGLEVLAGGELVCMQCQDLEGGDPELLAKLASTGVAALAVQVAEGRAFPAPAKPEGLPVLRVPESWTWDRFSRVVFHELTRLSDNVEFSRNLLEELTGLVLEGGDAGQIVQRLYVLLHCTVLLVDRDLQPLLTAGDPLPPNTERDLLRKLHRMALGQGLYFRYSLPLEGKGMCTVKSISFHSAVYGYLIAMSAPSELRHQDMITLHHGSTAIALLLLQVEAGRMAANQQRHRFIVNLVLGLYRSLDTIRAQGRAVGFAATGPLYVAVCQAGAAAEKAPPDDPARPQRQPLHDLLAGKVARVLEGQGHCCLATEFNDCLLVICGQNGRGENGPERMRDLLTQVLEDLRPLLPSVGVAVGLSRAVSSPLSLPDAFEQASEALDVGRRIRGQWQVMTFDDLGSYRIITRLLRDAALLDLTRTLLGPLVEYDNRHGGELLRTLRALLAQNLQTEASARAVYVHPNTIRYRQRKIEELTCIRLQSSEHRFELQFALRVLDLLGVEAIWRNAATT